MCWPAALKKHCSIPKADKNGSTINRSGAFQTSGSTWGPKNNRSVPLLEVVALVDTLVMLVVTVSLLVLDTVVGLLVRVNVVKVLLVDVEELVFLVGSP